MRCLHFVSLKYTGKQPSNYVNAPGNLLDSNKPWKNWHRTMKKLLHYILWIQKVGWSSIFLSPKRKMVFCCSCVVNWTSPTIGTLYVNFDPNHKFTVFVHGDSSVQSYIRMWSSEGKSKAVALFIRL